MDKRRGHAKNIFQISSLIFFPVELQALLRQKAKVGAAAEI
jgi:hypothetical protein